VGFLGMPDVTRSKSCFAAPAWSEDGGGMVGERDGLNGDAESRSSCSKEVGSMCASRGHALARRGLFGGSAGVCCPETL
jgi:hypothetical protein